jgi:hypothetical protein
MGITIFYQKAAGVAPRVLKKMHLSNISKNCGRNDKNRKKYFDIYNEKLFKT